MPTFKPSINVPEKSIVTPWSHRHTLLVKGELPAVSVYTIRPYRYNVAVVPPSSSSIPRAPLMAIVVLKRFLTSYLVRTRLFDPYILGEGVDVSQAAALQ